MTNDMTDGMETKARVSQTHYSQPALESSQGSMPACQQPLAPQVPVTPYCRAPPKPNLRILQKDHIERMNWERQRWKFSWDSQPEKMHRERQRHVPKEPRSQPSGRMFRQAPVLSPQSTLDYLHIPLLLRFTSISKYVHGKCFCST